MSDATFEPFCCPVQGCNNNGQSRKFGDAKHFYLHWYSTHKPRCPRTDCKFSLKDLSKTTESYLLRHWATHFPELKSEQSACDKCGRHFANANNRDRHVARCTSGTSGDDRIVAEETGHEFDLDAALDAALDAVGATAPENDPFDWSGLMGDQGPSGTLLSEGMSFLNEFALPSVCMVEPPSMTTVAPPISTRHDAVSTMDLRSGYTMVGQTPASSLPHDPSSLPVQGPRVIELEEESANNFSGAKLDHMFDPNVLEVTAGADTVASSSRKRLWGGETTQREKRQQTVVIDADHSNTSFNFSDPNQRDCNSGEIWPSRETEGSMTQGSSFPLELTAPAHHQSTAVSFQIIDDHDYPLSHCTVSGNLPLRVHQQYTRKTWTRTISKKQARCVYRSKQLIAVKSCVQTVTGHQQVSYDHHTWIHKLVHGSRRTTDTTTILVNNVMISKKTRFPRVIDDNAIIFQLCATGQYAEVNKLLTQGDASIVNVNSRGETLLHIAVSHWQVEVCRLLLAKGADIEAREWLNSHTPLGLVCFYTPQGGRGRAATANLSRNDLVDTVRLLIESGVDVCVSVEVDESAHSLADALLHTERTVSRSEKLKIIGGLSWLFRKYIQATTCDGVLPTDVLHPKAFSAMNAPTLREADDNYNIWSWEVSDSPLFTRSDTLAFQSFWLYCLHDATETAWVFAVISHTFCCTYTGGFHYRLSLEIGGRTTKTSPMESALNSFAALGTFHHILLATEIDVKGFTKVECTMPWCDYTQQTLERFFSLDPCLYSIFERLFQGKPMCFECDKKFERYNIGGLGTWEAVVGLVESGRSLASVLEFASEAEMERILEASEICESCEMNRYENSMSEGHRSDSEEDFSEWMGFVEVEPEQGIRGNWRISTLDDDHSEDHRDADTSDEDSIDEDATDEEF